MKKADIAWETVVIIVIFAVAAIGLFTITALAGINAKTVADKGTCLQSINNAALMKKAYHPQLGDPLFGINCPRQDVTIKKRAVVDYNKINQTKADSIIADEMKNCWDKVGAGHVDPFSDWNDVEDKSICLICTRLRFDDSLVSFIKQNTDKYNSGGRNNGMQPSDFLIINPLAYLQETPVPNQRYTYFRYLFASDPENKLTPQEKAELGTTAVDDNTLIMVRMYKPGGRDWMPSKTTIAAIGAGTLIAIGIIAAIPSGGTSLTLTVAGATILTVSATTVVVTTGVSVGIITAATIIGTSTAYNAFKDCPDCKGIGSVIMVPSTKNLYEKSIPYENEKGQKDIKPICDILVN